MRNDIHITQRGFLLPAAIFLLVILAGLGAYALNVTSVQQNASMQDVQTTRAYHAARAGVEWAAYKILQTPPLTDLTSCPATTTLTLDGFSVQVNCTPSADYKEQGDDHTIRLYEITSRASFGTVNTTQYYERQIDVTLSKCQDSSATSNSLCL